MVETNRENLTREYKRLRGDDVCMSTPTKVNVRLTTTPDSHSVTASDTWLSRYLVVDSTLGMHQVLFHIVPVNR